MSKINVSRMELNAAELAAPERREGEGSEPDRSAGASNSEGARLGSPTSSGGDSEVSAKAQRRRFTADYKRSIVEQADAGQDRGAIGERLRREGLYSSHLSTWRRQGRQGELAALAPKKRGRKLTLNPLVVENRKRLVANAGLSKRLENAELIIEVQKKLASLLGNPIPEIKIDAESE